jgi:hypothetical protein
MLPHDALAPPPQSGVPPPGPAATRLRSPRQIPPRASPISKPSSPRLLEYDSYFPRLARVRCGTDLVTRHTSLASDFTSAFSLWNSAFPQLVTRHRSLASDFYLSLQPLEFSLSPTCHSSLDASISLSPFASNIFSRLSEASPVERSFSNEALPTACSAVSPSSAPLV